MHPDRVMEGESGFFATVDDIQLARARRGDIGALEDLYRRFSGPVFTLARRLGRSREEAEEILQETFLEMLRSIRSFRGDGAFGPGCRPSGLARSRGRRRSMASDS